MLTSPRRSHAVVLPVCRRRVAGDEPDGAGPTVAGPRDGAVPGNVGRAKSTGAHGGRDVRGLRGPDTLAYQVGRRRGTPLVHHPSALVPPESSGRPGVSRLLVPDPTCCHLLPFHAEGSLLPSALEAGPEVVARNARPYSVLAARTCAAALQPPLWFCPAGPFLVWLGHPRCQDLLQPCRPLFGLARSPRLAVLAGFSPAASYFFG